MRAFGVEEFAALEGESFSLVLGERTITVNLAGVRRLPDSGREGGAFVLDWHGPYEPVLPQDIYVFRHGDAEFEIFIVPIAQTRDGTRYEAVFN
jgi:hypothetical protein